MVYYFGELGAHLLDDIRPYGQLFATEDDAQARKQFIWLSSPGVEMHTHVDQDHNLFVQLAGRKTFYLWPGADHEEMHVFPRIHPMWHKSQCAFGAGPTAATPGCGTLRPFVAHLHPGDLLYVPPLTFHRVVAEDASVSLSTWSHDHALYRKMFMVYRRSQQHDELGHPEGKKYALRLYLDLLVHEVYGKNITAQVMGRILRSRYTGVAPLFPLDDPGICLFATKDKGARLPATAELFSRVRAGVVEQDAPRYTFQFLSSILCAQDHFFSSFFFFQ